MKLKQIAIVSLAFVSLSSRAELPYAKPIDTNIKMTASFAELRANHFHTGVDLGTSGVTGINVFAAEDGYVSRVKVSAFGYGRALYIDHPDGRTTVYAHLNAYAAKIDSLVRREQMKRKSFEIDWYPAAGEIRVERGEVVAYSGNTGSSGGPHLHFEVRTTDTERALNPLEFLDPVADNQQPTIYGAKLYVLDDDAQVAGRYSDKYYTKAEISGQTIDAIGTVGIGIHATDYFTADGRPCGLVAVKLFDGEKLVFHSILDTVSFDKSRFINSYIDYAEWTRNKRFVQKSFVEPGNMLDNYRTANEFVIAEGEVHKMRYELFDFAGNKSVMSFTLRGRANANAAKHSSAKGALVDWQRTWAADTLGISVVIPRESFYKNETIAISAKESETMHRTVWTVGSGAIPVHKNISLSMPIPERLQRVDRAKIIGVMVDSKNRLTALTSTANDTLVEAKAKALGRFTVACDTVPPKVVSRNTRSNLTATNYVMVGLSDDLSGIAKYDCYIDGEWKIFEYDYKKTMLKAQVQSLDLEKGSHKLQAIVVDACGNEGRFDWTFNVM